MSRSSIHISISKPCHERWESMTETEQGAFCHSCQTEVIDFSMMTDREVIEYLEKHKTGCGRFRKDQLDTKLTISKVDNGIFRWRALMLGIMSLISLKSVFASANPVSADFDQKDTATKNLIDTVKLKEVLVNPHCKMVGEIAVKNTNQPIYQIPTKESDSIPEPFLDPVEKYLTSRVGGITVTNGYRKPGWKVQYWFRRIFRIRKKN